MQIKTDLGSRTQLVLLPSLVAVSKGNSLNVSLAQVVLPRPKPRLAIVNVEYNDIFCNGTQERSFVKEALFNGSVVEEFTRARRPHHCPDVHRPSLFGRTFRWRIKAQFHVCLLYTSPSP